MLIECRDPYKFLDPDSPGTKDYPLSIFLIWLTN